MSEQQIIFTITEDSASSRRVINVVPTLRSIMRKDGGEWIILAIAANCVRMIAKQDGLERAVERFIDFAVNHTKVIRP